VGVMAKSSGGREVRHKQIGSRVVGQWHTTPGTGTSDPRTGGVERIRWFSGWGSRRRVWGHDRARAPELFGLQCETSSGARIRQQESGVAGAGTVPPNFASFSSHDGELSPRLGSPTGFFVKVARRHWAAVPRIIRDEPTTAAGPRVSHGLEHTDYRQEIEIISGGRFNRDEANDDAGVHQSGTGGAWYREITDCASGTAPHPGPTAGAAEEWYGRRVWL
jgi:hypothetical protein